MFHLKHLHDKSLRLQTSIPHLKGDGITLLHPRDDPLDVHSGPRTSFPTSSLASSSDFKAQQQRLPELAGS